MLHHLHETATAGKDYLYQHAHVLHPHALPDYLPNALHHVSHSAFTIPIIPIVIVTIREIKLLVDEKSSLDEVIGHAIVQVGSITLFGFLGKQLGFWIGGLLGGPPGAIVGGAIGACVEKARRRLASTRARYELLPPEERWNFISQWVANSHFESPQLSAQLGDLTAGLDALHEQVENLLKTHSERVDKLTSSLESKLAAKLERLYSATQAKLQPLLLQVQERRAEMVKLGEAAGVNFAS